MRRQTPLKLTPCLLLLLAVLLPLSAHAAETRGVKRVEIKTTAGEAIGLYEQSHALVIGVSAYQHWPKLPGVRRDVADVTAALESNGFTVQAVLDPDQDALDEAFEGFIEEHGGNPENRLLFYFAGHGHTVQPKFGGEPLGYLVPTDAPVPTLGKREARRFKRVAMSMQRIEEYALNIDAKHALFLFDACFSGSLFALSRAIPESISYKTAKPVRQFITSGSADETVPDQSIFRGQFVAALQGEADTNGDGYLSGTELGQFLQDSVVNYSKGAQHPQYGKIRNPNLDKGDFVFMLGDPDRNRWAEQQQQMRREFADAQARQQAQLDALIARWESFLGKHAEDNPFSAEDESLRQRAESEIAFLSGTAAPAAIAAAPQALSPQRPASNPEAAKLMKTYRLAKKRNLATLAEQSLQALVSKHPDTPEGREAPILLLSARIEQEGVNQATEEAMLSLEIEQPDSPQVAKVRRQAAAWLLAEGDRRLEAEDYEGALAHYEKAASYGADADALRRKQIGIKEQQIQALIDAKRFQEAEVALVKWEASGDAPQATLRALERLKQARRAEAHQREWKRITFLVNQKRFNDAESALAKWEATGDTPGNLDELQAYLQLQKDAELKRMKAERRRKKEEEEKRRKLLEAIWTDPKTGLAWQRRDEGTERNWDDAKHYCRNLSLGGKSDWRLPNKKELQSIVDTSRKNPAINPTHFPGTKATFYWSSTTDAGSSPRAWSVHFNDGNVYTYGKGYANPVRCVRNAR